MSDWWRFGDYAAVDNYEDLPPPTARITVRPRLPFDLPQEGSSAEEERRLAEYAAALVREPKKEAPQPIDPSIYDTKQYISDASTAAAQRLARPYERANRESQSNVPAVADFLKPETPLDYALMVGSPGFGLVGKALTKLPRALRIGAVAAGGLTTADEAFGGASGAAKKTTSALRQAISDALTPTPPAKTAKEAPGSVLDPKTPPLPPLPPGSLASPYVTNPVRIANPGVYKNPRDIAREAAANVVPEHPALKALFGVTRDDLYQISQQGRRQGNVTEPNIWTPNRPGKINEAAQAVINPTNAQRLIDTLSEARKYEGLEKGMVPWYVMDPLYRRMEQLVGPERAAKEYHDFNMSMTPFSAGSSVPMEINRGTAANMMRMRGEYPTFQEWGGLAGNKRGPDYPEILRDVKGMMGHGGQATPVARYMATGQHGYGKDSVKINLYSGASGVPETGFQTRWAVPDAHFTRAVGVPDARKIPDGYNEYMGGTEYRPIGPWYREAVAEPLGIEAVPAQALMWGTYGPQTGVKTKIGAGKLELISKSIWDRAEKLGIDPKKLRDDVLSGKAHATWLLGALIPAGMMGGLASQDNYDNRDNL